MSWLTDLAGKAEDILNKIDSSTAGFIKENTEVRLVATPVCSVNTTEHKRSSSSCSLPSLQKATTNSEFTTALPSKSLASSCHGTIGNSFPLRKDSINSIEEHTVISDLLNTECKPGSCRSSNNATSLPDIDRHSRDSSISSGSSFLAVSDRESPRMAASEGDMLSGESSNSDHYVKVEAVNKNNFMQSQSISSSCARQSTSKELIDHVDEASLLKDELRSLNQELIQALNRTKQAEKELHVQQEKFSSLCKQQKQTEALLRESQDKEFKLQEILRNKEKNLSSLQALTKNLKATADERDAMMAEMKDQNDRLLKGADATSNMHAEAIKTLQEKLVLAEDALTKEKESCSSLREGRDHRIAQVEEELMAISKELSNSHEKASMEKQRMNLLLNENSNLKLEVSRLAEELSEYKAKAGRILQAKDSLIASFKENQGIINKESVLEEEFVQLKEERALLQEELDKSLVKFKLMHDELKQVEERAQLEANEAFDNEMEMQEELSQAKMEAVTSMEELKIVKQELQRVQEDSTRQKVDICTRLSERDEEIQRLKNQITKQRVNISNAGITDLETRIHGLTQSLIEKQSTIESLSTDKHALQIQLEKLEKEYTACQALRNRETVVELTGDEGRNRVPSFLLESPFDGNVTRRVKKAYGTVDKLSIRLGVFLRRYPVARIFVLLYMAVLHLWVMIVLFTYQPEIHGPSRSTGLFPKPPDEK